MPENLTLYRTSLGTIVVGQETHKIYFTQPIDRRIDYCLGCTPGGYDILKVLPKMQLHLLQGNSDLKNTVKQITLEILNRKYLDEAASEKLRQAYETYHKTVRDLETLLE